MAEIKWGYAVNQWRNLEVDLVRKDQMESAFKVISVCGFNGIEITDTAIGTHDYIPGLFGSVRNFMNFLNDCGIERVCSFFYGYYRGSPLNPADHGKLAEEAGRTAEFIAQTRCVALRREADGALLQRGAHHRRQDQDGRRVLEQGGGGHQACRRRDRHALGLPLRDAERERHRQAAGVVGSGQRRVRHGHGGAHDRRHRRR